jgi:hypothetical protein
MWQIISESDKLKNYYTDVSSEYTTQNIDMDPSRTDTNWNIYKVISESTNIQRNE